MYVFLISLHTGLSPDLQSMEQVRRIMRPTDVPDQGLLCDLLWADPDKETMGWGENDRGVSFTFGPEIVSKFLHKHDMDLICRAHQVYMYVYTDIHLLIPVLYLYILYLYIQMYIGSYLYYNVYFHSTFSLDNRSSLDVWLSTVSLCGLSVCTYLYSMYIRTF